jgi:hypothetical protein
MSLLTTIIVIIIIIVMKRWGSLRQLDVQLNMARFNDASTSDSIMSLANLGNSLDIYYQNDRGLRTKA